MVVLKVRQIGMKLIKILIFMIQKLLDKNVGQLIRTIFMQLNKRSNFINYNINKDHYLKPGQKIPNILSIENLYSFKNNFLILFNLLFKLTNNNFQISKKYINFIFTESILKYFLDDSKFNKELFISQLIDTLYIENNNIYINMYNWNRIFSFQILKYYININNIQYLFVINNNKDIILCTKEKLINSPDFFFNTFKISTMSFSEKASTQGQTIGITLI